ncbi:MAG: alpha/beta hydrolase [Gammaproteobacteria bacterium]
MAGVKKRFLLLSAFLLATGLTGCAQPGLFLVNGLAGLDDYQSIENIAYGPEKLNTLNLFKPNDPAARPKPVVVFFYGGCWGGCETLTKENYLFVAQALTSSGYVAVLPDYRIHPEAKFPQMMDDAKRSVEWVRHNIENFDGDPDNIFLMGHSAGAHLAAMLTLNESYLEEETYRSIKGFIGLAGPYDFLPFKEPYQKIVFGPPESYPESQPVNFVDGTEPPLLLLYGNDDATVKPRNIENLAAVVRRAGGAVETRRYDRIDHTGLLEALTRPLQDHEPVLKDIVVFVNGNVSDRN